MIQMQRSFEQKYGNKRHRLEDPNNSLMYRMAIEFYHIPEKLNILMNDNKFCISYIITNNGKTLNKQYMQV